MALMALLATVTYVRHVLNGMKGNATLNQHATVWPQTVIEVRQHIDD